MSSPENMKGQAAAIHGPSPATALPAGRAMLLLVFAFAVVVLLCHLGQASLWGSEGRWAVIARHMFLSGELFNPMLGVAPYWDKPLISYWQILPAAYALGGVDEFASRLPSVLWALVLLFLTHDLAKRWLGSRSAFMAVFVLSTTYGFVFWGRNAQVEMTNAAVILLILWYFFTRKGSERPAWIVVMAALMGLGANMKGLTTVGVPVFYILLRSLVKRDWGWVPKWPAIILAAGAFTVSFLLVPVISSLAVSSWQPLYMIWKENVLRFFSPFDHKAPIYTYFVRIFDLAAPWSLLLPPALLRFLGRDSRREDGITECLLAFAAIFLFFTLSGSRRSYYLLPILPFAAILSGHLLSEYFGRRLSGKINGAVMALGFLMSVCFLMPLACLFIMPNPFPYSLEGLLPWAIAVAAGGVVMAAGFARRIFPGVMAPVFMVWLIFVLAFIPWQASHGDDDRSEAARINTMNRPVAFLHEEDAKVLFYLNRPAVVLSDMEQARAWAKSTGGIVIYDRNLEDPPWERISNRKEWKAYIHRDR